MSFIFVPILQHCFRACFMNPCWLSCSSPKLIQTRMGDFQVLGVKGSWASSMLERGRGSLTAVFIMVFCWTFFIVCASGSQPLSPVFLFSLSHFCSLWRNPGASLQTLTARCKFHLLREGLSQGQQHPISSSVGRGLCVTAGFAVN